jgi:putative phosphoribosyl transferase
MFHDRSDAGRKLAPLVAKYKKQKDVIVLGLPRGGVVTAFEVALFLEVPLDIICPRKVGAPQNPELALGAVTETGKGFFNNDLIERLGVSTRYLEEEIAKEKLRAQTRLSLYRKDRPPLHLQGKTVLLIDDGVATGATMKAAILAVKDQKAAKIIVAVPVSPPDTAEEIREMVDEFVSIATPSLFQAVGQFYRNFGQTEDAEVIALLRYHSDSN